MKNPIVYSEFSNKVKTFILCGYDIVNCKDSCITLQKNEETLSVEIFYSQSEYESSYFNTATVVITDSDGCSFEMEKYWEVSRSSEWYVDFTDFVYAHEKWKSRVDNHFGGNITTYSPKVGKKAFSLLKRYNAVDGFTEDSYIHVWRTYNPNESKLYAGIWDNGNNKIVSIHDGFAETLYERHLAH